MKVILLKDIPHLGRKDDIKDVSEGYARNFLLPKRLVALATPAVLQDVAQKKTHKENTAATERERFASAAKKMGGMALAFKMKMGDTGKTFGSINSAKIAEALHKAGIPADKEWIVLEDPIKTVGEHAIAVRFPHDITGKIKIIVEPE